MNITQAELDAVYREIQTPCKYGMVVTTTADEGAVDIDCQGVFRFGNKWYMTYVSHNAHSEFGGYRTNLASSENLLEWHYEGVIFQNSAEHPQCAAFPALLHPEWGGDNELEPLEGKYWWTTMEGMVKGYEGEPMNIGLLSTVNPADPHSYVHEKGLLLTTEDADVRPGEHGTLYKSNVIHDKEKRTGHEYVMYYNAKDSSPWIERIFMAVSDDMKTWKRYGEQHVLYMKEHTITGDPQVVKIGDLWVMNLFGYRMGSPAYDTFAVSKDLVHWTLWNGEPTVRASEDYDNKHAHKPWLLKANGIVYHFYCARAMDGRPRGIALATSKPVS